MPSAKTFFTDRPIAYHPILAKVCGSVTAALFLSQLAYWSDKGASRDGWIWKTQAEMEDETGLSRSEQETARKVLTKLGILQEERRGVPARMWYLINWDVLTNLIDQFEQSRLQESSKLDCEKPANYSEITTENTTEILSKGEPPKSERQEALETMQAAFEKCGGYLNPTMIQRFYAAYDANSDNRPARLEHAVLKLQTDKNFFRAVDAYMQWKPPTPPPEYAERRERITRQPQRYSNLPVRTD